MRDKWQPGGLTRRALLAGTGAGLAAACTNSPVPSPAPDVVSPNGPHQPGVATPAQPHCQLVFLTLVAPPGQWASLLAGLGKRIAHLATRGGDALAGMPPSDLTTTVGVGPRVVASVDPELPGATELPEFTRERIEPARRGADLTLQVCATDPLVVTLAMTELVSFLGASAQVRWRQTLFRGPTLPGTPAARNLLGFTDGIVAPPDLDAGVWLRGPERVRGGTIGVYRAMRLDVDRFLALDVSAQERVFGRRRGTSEPLSGGGAASDVDLQAKSPDGEYLIPVDAHVRRAHPRAAGVPLMLRRSYSMEDGLMFISFQDSVRTFVATQARMDEGDALMSFVTVVGSAVVLILPGFGDGTELGASLF